MKYYGNNHDVVCAFIRDPWRDGKNPGKTLYFGDGVLYSYGSHFPLAFKTHADIFMLNGDTSTVTTGRHQSLVRSAIHTSCRVIVPFSALVSMFSTRYPVTGILPYCRTIKPIHWTEDRHLDTGRKNKHGNKIYRHVLGACLFEWEHRRFLSGMDESGTGDGLFFLTELADNTVQTVAEAYESMKPLQIKEAEKRGVEIYRQGEWMFFKSGYHAFDESSIKIEDTNYYLQHRDPNRVAHHKATAGFMTTDGRQFVKGIVRHNGNEHRALKLYLPGTKEKDQNWFEAFEAVQLGSWSAGGRVD